MALWNLSNVNSHSEYRYWIVVILIVCVSGVRSYVREVSEVGETDFSLSCLPLLPQGYIVPKFCSRFGVHTVPKFCSTAWIVFFLVLFSFYFFLSFLLISLFHPLFTQFIFIWSVKNKMVSHLWCQFLILQIQPIILGQNLNNYIVGWKQKRFKLSAVK